MRRLLIVLAFLLVPSAAKATSCSIPYVFTAGTPAIAANVNANFSSLQTCGNAIDSSNIGVNGIYASQIIPTTVAQATFGGTVGYVFGPFGTGTTPLTVNITASPVVDAVDFEIGGQRVVYVNANGDLIVVPNSGTALQITGAATFSTTATAAQFISTTAYGNTTAANLPLVWPAATGNATFGADSGITVNGVTAQLLGITGNGSSYFAFDEAGDAGFYGYVAAGGVYGNTSAVALPYHFQANGGNSTFGASTGFTLNGVTASAYAFTSAGTLDFAVDQTGDIAAAGAISSQSDGSHSGWVEPVYTNAGAATAKTEHEVRGNVSTTCSASSQTNCTLGSSTVSFTNAGAFASSTSYNCTLTNYTGGSNNPVVWSVVSKATGTLTVQGFNPSSSSYSGATVGYDYVCEGT